MQVIHTPVKLSYVASEIPYGECCTFPRYENNKLCMHVKANQTNVQISTLVPSANRARMLDLATGTFYLVDPCEPCIPVSAVVRPMVANETF